MKELYRKLFEDLEGEYRFHGDKIGIEDMCHFVAMKGKKYDPSAVDKVKLMIVGRAVNDWLQLNTANAESFGVCAEKEYTNNKFNWVYDTNSEGVRRLCTLNDSGKEYFLNNSAFWRTSEQIWRRLSSLEDFRWIDHIAWSNLYKIAPKKANPTTTMCKKQFAACADILKREIDDLKPTLILMITGYSWWRDYNGCNFADELFTYISERGKHTCDKEIIVEATAFYECENRRIPVIVTCRPERCSNELFVQAVVEMYNDMIK